MERQYMKYEDFLQTHIWKQTTEKVKCLAGGQCELCFATSDTLHAHHMTYAAWNRAEAPSWVPQGWLPDYVWLACLDTDCHKYLKSLDLLGGIVEKLNIIRNRTEIWRWGPISPKLDYQRF